MEEYHVEKAILVPNNDGRMYYEHARETNKWLGEVQKKYPDRFYAFADILKEGKPIFTKIHRIYWRMP